MNYRATGKPVGPGVRMKSSDSFLRLPRLEQRVWRYMDCWKFENLVNHKALYFRRSDRLEDEMEGRYAEANRSYTTAVWRRFTQAYGITHSAEAQEQDALIVPPLKWNGCKTGGPEWDLLPVDFLRTIRCELFFLLLRPGSSSV